MEQYTSVEIPPSFNLPLSPSFPPSLPPSIHFLPHLCQCVYLCVFQQSGPEHTFPFKEKKPRKKCEGVVCEAEHLHVKGKNLRSRGVNSSVIPQDWWQGEGHKCQKDGKFSHTQDDVLPLRNIGVGVLAYWIYVKEREIEKKQNTNKKFDFFFHVVVYCWCNCDSMLFPVLLEYIAY